MSRATRHLTELVAWFSRRRSAWRSPGWGRGTVTDVNRWPVKLATIDVTPVSGPAAQQPIYSLHRLETDGARQ